MIHKDARVGFDADKVIDMYSRVPGARGIFGLWDGIGWIMDRIYLVYVGVLFVFMSLSYFIGHFHVTFMTLSYQSSDHFSYLFLPLPSLHPHYFIRVP